MKTIQEKAKEYALKRYPITDPYDAHLPISDERGNVEEAFENGAQFGFDLAIKKLVEFKNEDTFKPEPDVYERHEVCPECGGCGSKYSYSSYKSGKNPFVSCTNCNGTGYITIK